MGQHSTPLSHAALDVIAERDRQKAEEGWTADHDDGHQHFEMARAAAFYVLHTAATALPHPSPDAPSDRHGMFLLADNAWPPEWDRPRWKKPKDARRNLVRAGALILAELERLDREEDRARQKAWADNHARRISLAEAKSTERKLREA